MSDPDLIEGEAFEVRRPGPIRIGWGAVVWWSINVGGFALFAHQTRDGPWAVVAAVILAGLVEPMRRASRWAYQSMLYQVPAADADQLLSRITPFRRKAKGALPRLPE